MKITKAELIDWVNEHFDYFEEVEDATIEFRGFGRVEQLQLSSIFMEKEDENIEK